VWRIRTSCRPERRAAGRGGTRLAPLLVIAGARGMEDLEPGFDWLIAARRYDHEIAGACRRNVGDTDRFAAIALHLQSLASRSSVGVSHRAAPAIESGPDRCADSVFRGSLARRIARRRDQVGYAVERILESREAGVPLKTQAVLFRAAHHSAELEIELSRRNVPFVKFGGLRFLEAAHVKDVLSVHRVASFRVLQLMPGIGPTTAGRLIERIAERLELREVIREFRPPAATQAGRHSSSYSFDCGLPKQAGRATSVTSGPGSSSDFTQMHRSPRLSSCKLLPVISSLP
jgi:hypothetical protein